ncbi:Fc.00g113910.m01.CDS01 [Cosmosporella sp. VM-42]
MDTTTGALSPAIDTVADAQPANIKLLAGLPHPAAFPPPSEGSSDVWVHALVHERSLDLGFDPDWVRSGPLSLEELPNEVLFNIFGFLDISDLLSASRTNHLFHSISCSPILHHYRLRRARCILPPLLWSPSRPSLADLIARRIFLSNNSVVSRRLARSLVSIRLSRRLAARPSPETLVERAVLPKECVPGMSAVPVAPGLVAKKKAIEKERVKDGLRRWIATKWKGEVREREEGIKRWEESRGIGRVWRLRKFWERVGRGDDLAARATVQ